MNDRDDRTTQAKQVIIEYTNHRGERSERRIIPEAISFAFSPHHEESQWLLEGWDLDKVAVRTFAIKDIHSWRVAWPGTPEQGGETR